MKKLLFRTIMSAALLLGNFQLFAQQDAFVTPAGTKFLLYTPPGYSTSTSTVPLLLSLHSKGEVGDDLTELTSRNPEQMPSRLIYLNRWPKDLPFIVLTPQLKPTASDPDPQWSADYIDEVVRYVVERYRVDVNRIYVTGISRGGTGAWTYASAYPEKVAALIPLSGRSDLAQACPIKNIPIWAFHGDGDLTAVPEYSIDMVNAINSCQPQGIYKPRLNILNARGHNGWSEVYNYTNDYKIYEWLLMFSKNSVVNKPPYVNAGKDIKVMLRSQPLNLVGDYFDSDGDVTTVLWRQTSGVALTLSNTSSNFLQLSNLKVGTFEFELTVTDNKGLQSRDKVIVEITNTLTSPYVSDLILINGKTNVEIGKLSEGQVIDKSALGLSEINIRAVASPETLSVRFSVNTDQNTRTVNSTSPLLIKTPTTGPEWKIKNGEYLICATPYSKGSAGGVRGISQCFRITVVDQQTCTGTGKITREVWTGISGKLISSIPLNSAPTTKGELTIFESPSSDGDNYGSRVRGYVCVPTSGSYKFWISSDDTSELWLSTDDNPANKKKIASVSGYTNKRQWDKYASQQSASINLLANRKYYIEALHKEATGGDHLAVGWQLPNGVLERPIAGIRLLPMNTTTSAASTEVDIVSAPEMEIDIYPNPFKAGVNFLNLSQAGDSHVKEGYLKIISQNGEIIYQSNFRCDKNCETLSFEIGPQIPRGIYVVVGYIDKKEFSKRILVE